jgi:hypothetical protein
MGRGQKAIKKSQANASKIAKAIAIRVLRKHGKPQSNRED